MNSKLVIVVTFCALISVAYGRPSVDEIVDVSAPTIRQARAIPDFSQEELADVSAPTHSIRQKRATCDLLSGLGVNHSACAAHCIAIGRKGGYCNSQAVCVCRN